MLGYKPEDDTNRHNSEPHYRLYYYPPEKKVIVVCVQDFDYRDYDEDGWVGYEAFATQEQAELALLGLKALFANS